jgi:hypothetical protein
MLVAKGQRLQVVEATESTYTSTSVGTRTVSPHSAAEVATGREYLRLSLPLLALVALCTTVGLTKVHYHLMDDQTLFLRGAEVLRNGGTLYRDIWDIKPPGVFLFYLAGGEMFGFTDVGIHLFELLIMVSTAVVSFLWLRPAIGAWAAWMGAFLTVFFYYSMNFEGDFCNVEALACLPAAIAGFSLLSPRGKWPLVMAGASAGFLIVIKPFYGLIGLGFWAVFLIADREASRRLSTWVVLLMSAAAPVLAMVVWFAWQGALPQLFDALIRIPFEAKLTVNPLGRLWGLRIAVEHFLSGFKPLWPMLIAAVWAAYENRRNRGVLTAVAFLGMWIVTGAIGVILQLQSWFPAEFLLILPPFGLLAGVGLIWTLGRIMEGAWPKRALAILLLGVSLWTARAAVRPLVVALWKTGGEVAPSANFERHRRQLQYDARQVTCTPSDTALVWMSPMVYWFSGCRAASPVEGTRMLWMPPRLLARVRDDIRRSSPRYIYLRDSDIAPFTAAMPGLMEQYAMEYQSTEGAWYRLKGARVEN